MAQPRRVGILGGTFNPVHNAHLAMAYFAMNEFDLGQVLFIPSGKPPHKRELDIAGPEHRFNMLLHACEDERFVPSRIELDRKGYSYSVDTLRELHAQYPADTELFFIIGGDTLFDLENWKDSRQVMGMCRFIAFRRDDVGSERVQQAASRLNSAGASVLISRNIVPDISSTMIRRKAALGEPLTDYVPASVERYINQYRVYGSVYDA